MLLGGPSLPTVGLPSDSNVAMMAAQGFSQVEPAASLVAPLMAPSMMLGNGFVDTRLALFQQTMPFYQQQQALMQQEQFAMNAQLDPMLTLPSIAGAPQMPIQGPSYIPDNILHASIQGIGTAGLALSLPAHPLRKTGRNISEDTQASTSTQSSEHSSRSEDSASPASSLMDSSALSDKQDAAYALSFLSLADRPRFTEEEEAEEQATMTDEEKAAVLVDTFGKLRKANRHKNKKARRDLDRNSIDFLIRRMKHEIDLIPKEKKTALLEALEHCSAEEFSDARLERFLRVDGMNANVRIESLLPGCPWLVVEENV